MFYRSLSVIQSELDSNLNALHYCILLIQNGHKEFNITYAKSTTYRIVDELISNMLFLNKFYGYHADRHLEACRREFKWLVIDRIQGNGVIDLKFVYNVIVKKRRELKREKRQTVSYAKCSRFKEKEDARIALVKSVELPGIKRDRVFIKAGTSQVWLREMNISLIVSTPTDIILKVEI